MNGKNLGESSRNSRVKSLRDQVKDVKQRANSLFEGATDVFEKAGLAYVRGAPMLSTNTTRDDDKEAALAFRDASQAYLKLRKALLELAYAILAMENWEEETRKVLRLLLKENDGRQSELDDDIRRCLWASHYKPCTSCSPWQGFAHSDARARSGA